MLAPSPRADGVQYRVLAPYGLTVFDCPALLATIQPHHCAQNWKAHRDGSQCLGCPTGAIHNGKPSCEVQKAPPNSRAQPCCRCENKPSYRLIGGIYCPSCHIRTAEVLKAKNAKGKPPWQIAEKLREAFAIVKIDDAGSMLRQVFKTPAESADTELTRRLKIHHKPGLPFFSVLDAGHLWCSAVVTGQDELARIVSRLLPGATIADSEFLVSFAEKWRTCGLP